MNGYSVFKKVYDMEPSTTDCIRINIMKQRNLMKKIIFMILLVGSISGQNSILKQYIFLLFTLPTPNFLLPSKAQKNLNQFQKKKKNTRTVFFFFFFDSHNDVEVCVGLNINRILFSVCSLQPAIP